MTDRNAGAAGRSTQPRFVAALLVVGSMAVIGMGLLWLQQSVRPTPEQPQTDRQALLIPATDASEPSPYRNTALDVAYVGDAACVVCHREISESYSRHPMGRSMNLAIDQPTDTPEIPSTGASFDAQGFTYRVERADDQVRHSETRYDGVGKKIAEVGHEVAYALGSGTRGIAYLIERDGFLVQSPISWFAQERRWDLAPGYQVAENPHFGRPVDAACLFCHANQAKPVGGRVNQFETPVFRGLSIGCERCHGPGELHVDAHQRVSDTDFTIVNPARLDPPLREAVCQQCHMMGVSRIARAGRELFDFRPGLPLSDYLAIFAARDQDTQRFVAVGHGEQMLNSACYKESKGSLSCTSCHDPHSRPEPSEQVSFYRQRCLNCHETRGCSESSKVRAAHADNCLSCHMPKRELSNIPHTAATDHRIPRRATDQESRTVATGSGSDPLVEIFASALGRLDRGDSQRDLGVALVSLVRGGGQSPAIARETVGRALGLLSRNPLGLEDSPSIAAQVEAHRLLGQLDEAVRLNDSQWRRDPDDESARVMAGSLASIQERWGDARTHWGQAVRLSPYRAEYHLAFAESSARAGDWPAARTATAAALRLNPALRTARSLFVQACLATGDEVEARAALELIIAFAPAGEQIWENWYVQQSRLLLPRR